uniref:O-antigen ligase family protein n=1 Tax=Dietzia sp. SLG310A2-38A2 TaxID=1630643 RepID=UPI0015FA0072
MSIYVDGLAGRVLLVAGIVFGLVMRRLSLVQAVGLALPFMFVVSLGFNLNVGLVDFLLPVLLLGAVRSSWYDSMSARLFIGPALYGVAFLAWASFSFLMVPVLTSMTPDPVRFATEFLKIAVCIALFGSVAVLAYRDFKIGKIGLLDSWSAMALSTALVSIVELVRAGAWTSRFTGAFENPNLLGLYFVTSLAIVAVRALLIGRAPIGFISAIIVLGVVSTGSRGPMLATAIFVLIAPWVGRSIGVLYQFSLTLVGVGAVLALFVLGDRIPAVERLFSDSGTVDAGVRETLWIAALELWAQSPVSGIGLGQFSFVSPTYTVSHIGYVAHSTYLSLLAETGTVGAVIFFAPFVFIIVKLARNPRREAHLSVAALMWLPLLVNLGTLNAENARFVWVYLAVSFAAYYAVAQGTEPDPQISSRSAS